MIRLIPIIAILFINLSMAQNSGKFFSAENRLKFGNYLYEQKDYLRAIDEFRVYLKSFPNDTLILKTALALREMKNFSEAEDYLMNISFNSRLSAISRKELFKTYYIAGEYSKFMQEIENKRFIPRNGNFISGLKMAAQLIWGNQLPDSVKFANSFQKDIRPKMVAFFVKKKYPEYKNPLTAGILSAAIPGLGKIYSGDYGDGITAFIFNSVLGYLAYDNFKAGHNFRAWLFTGLTTLFYSGNIYGSVISATLRNAEYDLKLNEEIKKYVESENYFDPQVVSFSK